MSVDTAVVARADLLVRAAPDRFFVPPYTGPAGWVGVWLDGAVDWDELAELLRDGWALVAPKRLRLGLREPGGV